MAQTKGLTHRTHRKAAALIAQEAFDHLMTLTEGDNITDEQGEVIVEIATLLGFIIGDNARAGGDQIAAQAMADRASARITIDAYLAILASRPHSVKD